MMEGCKAKTHNLTHAQYVSKLVGKAIAEYDMLQDQDKIMVALSGGKDSLALLRLLRYRRTFIPIEFEMMSVFLDIGIPDFPKKQLEDHLNKEGIAYHFECLDVMEDQSWDELECVWCSRARKKALFDLADKFGFQKIATGHHLDDIAETILMNIFHHAEIGAMCPKQEFFNGKFTIIRPLAYVAETEIEQFVKEENLPVLDIANCPGEKDSLRRKLKKIMKELEKIHPSVKKNIIKSLKNIKMDYLL